MYSLGIRRTQRESVCRRLERGRRHRACGVRNVFRATNKCTTFPLFHPISLDARLTSGQVKSASVPFTLILDDPLANSYIQSLYAPEPDPAITVECYDRTWEQSEELGLNDMRVEGYGEE